MVKKKKNLPTRSYCEKGVEVRFVLPRDVLRWLRLQGKTDAMSVKAFVLKKYFETKELK